MKSLKQVPTILDYIDRSIFRNEYNDTEHENNALYCVLQE